jgi:hypothetical protein
MQLKIILLLKLLLGVCLSFSQTGNAGFRTSEIFKTPEARQGVAVDANYGIIRKENSVVVSELVRDK